VEQHRLGICGVERRVRERQFLDAPHLEANTFDVTLAGQSACGLDLTALDVDPDYFAGSNSLSEAQCHTARSTAAVEQPHARAQLLQEKAATLVRTTVGKIPVKGW
jgi:hypothetical protein